MLYLHIKKNPTIIWSNQNFLIKVTNKGTGREDRRPKVQIILSRLLPVLMSHISAEDEALFILLQLFQLNCYYYYTITILAAISKYSPLIVWLYSRDNPYNARIWTAQKRQTHALEYQPKPIPTCYGYQKHTNNEYIASIFLFINCFYQIICSVLSYQHSLVYVNQIGLLYQTLGEDYFLKKILSYNQSHNNIYQNIIVKKNKYIYFIKITNINQEV